MFRDLASLIHKRLMDQVIPWLVHSTIVSCTSLLIIYPQVPTLIFLFHKAFLSLSLSVCPYTRLLVIPLFLKCDMWATGEVWDGSKGHADKIFNSFNFLLLIRKKSNQHIKSVISQILLFMTKLNFFVKYRHQVLNLSFGNAACDFWS